MSFLSKLSRDLDIGIFDGMRTSNCGGFWVWDIDKRLVMYLSLFTNFGFLSSLFTGFFSPGISIIVDLSLVRGAFHFLIHEFDT